MALEKAVDCRADAAAVNAIASGSQRSTMRAINKPDRVLAVPAKTENLGRVALRHGFGFGDPRPGLDAIALHLEVGSARLARAQRRGPCAGHS
jgi:hypothetical protein